MSKAPYENYQGLQVPPAHSALFRAMDQQDRFYAEVMRMNEVSIKNALNQAAQKTIGELNAIRNNHLAAFDSKVLNEIFLKTNDHIIGNLLKNNISIDLSSNPAALANSYILNRIKAQIPDFFKEYKEMYDYISHPLNVPTNDLLQIKTQAELEPIKNAFLQNLEYLNTYFAYTEGHNYQSPISEISCREPLLEIVEDMGSKLDSFQESERQRKELTQKAQEDARNEELAQKEAEDEVNERHETSSQQSGGSSSPSKKSESRTDSDEVRLNPFNQGQNPNLSDRTGSFGRNSDVMQEEQPQPAPNSEMERMMARMREMEELLAAKDEEIRGLKERPKNFVSKEDVEKLVSEDQGLINRLKNELTSTKEENVAKDSIIREQARDKEFLEFKYSTSQDTVKRQDKALADKDKVIESKDKMLESKDKMLESQNKVIDNLNEDKKHLHEDVEGWKVSHELKEKQLIEFAELLNKNDKEPSDKLSFMQDFLNNSLIKGLQTISSHEYHSDLSGEASFVKLEELSDH